MVEKYKKILREAFSEIKFKEESHKYKVNGTELQSVSNFISEFYDKFDAEKIAPYSAKKMSKESGLKVTAQEVLDMWERGGKAARDMGTDVHDFAEAHSLNRRVKPCFPYLEKKKVVVQLWKDVPKYYKLLIPELKLFSEKWKLAGTGDILWLDTRDNTLVLGDYKTNKDLFKNHRGKKLHPPFNGMLDQPLNKYKIQLSAYQLLIEEATGLKVSQRKVFWITDTHYNIFNLEDISGKIRTVLEDRAEGRKSLAEYDEWE